ncbi:MAG: PspC domain-containing protein [Bacteroidales bacterium]|nr:PspC domain-containing protein [Bacteroidales bacterium]
MTEVQKVSIGGYAFTLEVEAYAIVKQYLDELNEYYSQREGGAEVMEGFEERMAELLYEKCGDNGVASVEAVNEIIAILGKPSAIESDDDPELKQAPDEQKTSAQEKRRDKKKLYRDPTGKMIGGVCSGLAAYFKIDVVIVRIVFIALFVLGVSVHFHNGNWTVNSIGGVMLLVYVALWIAMPEAKTVQQRWEMGISNPPAGGSPRGSDLGRVLSIIIGCFLLLIGVSGMTGGIAAIFGQRLFDWDIIREGWTAITDNVPEVLPLAGSYLFKTMAMLLYFLPFIGMTYGGIMMVFNIKSPSWRPGLVIFLVWVAALVVVVVLSIMGFAHYEWSW